MFHEGGGIHFPGHRNVPAPSFRAAAEISEFIVFFLQTHPPDLTERAVTCYSCSGLNFIGTCSF